MTDNQYWRAYYDEATLTRADALRSEHWIESTGVRLHIDVYERENAPAVIINHGGGGYSRIFIPVALALYDRGYTVILPDQRGQGYSEGDRGDFTLRQFVQNILDTADWAAARYGQPLFMAGGSVGGGLTYKAAAAGAPVQAVACHNLYNFGDPRDALAVSRLAPLAKVPGVPALSKIMTWTGAALLPGVKIPFRLLGAFEQMVDEREADFYPRWLADPMPIQAVSLRYLHSMSSTPPQVPYEQNTIPTLVINPILDKMTDPAITRRNYERLGGPKHYVEINYGHWATSDEYAQEWACIVDEWFRRHM